MEPCADTIAKNKANPRFMEGGIFSNAIADIEAGTNFEENALGQVTLCPQSGDINYSGVVGTNLWVVPKEVPDTTDENTQFLFRNNYARVDFLTAYFSIDDYIKFNEDGIWKTRVDSAYYFFTGALFSWDTYYDSISSDRTNMPSAAVKLGKESISVFNKYRTFDVS